MKALAVLALAACVPAAAAFADMHASPLQQLRDGVDAKDVQCAAGLALMIRAPSDPACVTQSSVDALSARGWSLEREASEAAPGAASTQTEVADSASAEKGAAMTDTETADLEGAAISGAYSPGPFAVGVVSNFVTDEERPFDQWGGVYKSEEYRKLLEKIDASGQRSTVPTMIYYPAVPGEGYVEREAFHPSPLLAAADGVRSTVTDLYMGNEELAAGAAQIMLKPSDQYQSFVGAEPAEGSFPLVVMAHGLGGGLFTWNQAAEYLASQGYVAVTLAHTSDSGSTPFLEDPNSPFAASADKADIDEAYRLRAQAGPAAVFANFLAKMYGSSEQFTEGSMPDPSSLTAVPGGGIDSGKTMGDLFEQRTGDVEAVIRTMALLGGPADQCREELGDGGDLCGFLEGAIDSESVGVMGHSLGSMTAQSALTFIPEVDTAIGFNNGMPKRWEPFGGLPDMGASPPAGVPKPVMLVIGSDDFFIYTVFSELHLRWYQIAGGDVSDTFPLPSESVRPSPDNPQPVAASAYERAQDAKVLLTFRDQGHDNLVDNVFASRSPGAEAEGTRVPFSADSAPEKYRALSWVRDDGGDVYLPHQMRNYFMTAWFDWQLKGDGSAREAITDHPFEIGVLSFESDGLS